MNPLRVVIADDHPAFLSGVQAYLQNEPDLIVVGIAEDGVKALQLARDLAPDVLLLDLEMPGMTGVEVTEALLAEGSTTQVLILSAYEDTDYIFGVLRQGAAGYLTKQEPMPAIVEAIRGVAGGETRWLSERIGALFAGRTVRRRRLPAVYETLSPRERETLDLLAQGHPNEAIAEALFVTPSTTKKHVVSIYEKLGVQTRAQAVAWAWRHGLVDGSSPEA